MAKNLVFVDGQAGTTGLEIQERLMHRNDLELLLIEEENRKNALIKHELINEADIVFLCLPDSAAKESAALVVNKKTRVIDASTAHRTDPNWIYGLPELSKQQRSQIANSNRISNPGCHATGFILALNPLIKVGIVQKDYPVTCHSISGYSGAGKKLIEQYQSAAGGSLEASRHYALGLSHKHLPEMQRHTGLDHPPHFTPIIANFYRGMAVAIPLFNRLLSQKLAAKDIHSILASYYEGEHFVKVMPFDSEANLNDGYFNPMACNNSNRAELFVFGHDDQALLLTRLDNLGKGASGAAIQNMNLVLGIEETTGLK